MEAKEFELSKYENTKNIFLKKNESYKFGEIFKNIPLETHSIFQERKKLRFLF